jgi:hypothetical protein
MMERAEFRITSKADEGHLLRPWIARYDVTLGLSRGNDEWIASGGITQVHVGQLRELGGRNVLLKYRCGFEHGLRPLETMFDTDLDLASKCLIYCDPDCVYDDFIFTGNV